MDDSDLDFFRSQSYTLPVTIEPEESADLVDISLAGFDGTHWTASYEKPLRRIDLGNLIEESSLVRWLDEVELSIAGGVGDVADMWSWTKKLNLKKRLDALWEDAKSDAIEEVNNLISPADEVEDFVRDNLLDISAVDSEGNLHTIPSSVIDSAATFAYNGISTWWADFVGNFIWSDVPTETLHEKVTKESWTWDWDPQLELTLSGGSVSLDPGWNELWQWIDSVSASGFTSELLALQSVTLGTTITADGSVAHAQLGAKMTGSITYTHVGVVDIETGETASGQVDFGIFFELHLSF